MGVEDVTVGDGAVAQKGDEVSMSYVGTLEADGSRFDAGTWAPVLPESRSRWEFTHRRRDQGLGPRNRRHARRRPPQASSCPVSWATARRAWTGNSAERYGSDVT